MRRPDDERMGRPGAALAIGGLILGAVALSGAQPPESQTPTERARWSYTPDASPMADLAAARPRAASDHGVPQNRLEWQILENPNGPHTALVLDPFRQVFAVYQVDSASGAIRLKSVRNLQADLRMPHINSSDPSPQDVEQMLQEARPR